jgi:hypothetical protein
MTNEQKLAVHEAAHACIRVALGGAVAYATINEDNPHVRPKKVLSERDEHVAIVCGICAEFLFFPDESKVSHYGADDWQRAELWSKEERDEAITRAKELVRTHARAIRKVAAKLRTQRLISGTRVKQIVAAMKGERPCTQEASCVTQELPERSP